MKKPMTTAEFFDLICSRLKDKGLLPEDILDYHLATYRPIPMRTYRYDIRNNLDYGFNEGIYLDLSIEYSEEGETKCAPLGTIKTLREDADGMRIMARLLADFIVEERTYANAHMDDFTWTGANVYAINEDGTQAAWYYCCYDTESAFKKRDELLQKYPCVVIRDIASRKETRYPQVA